MTVVAPTRERVDGQQVFRVFLMRKGQRGTQAKKRSVAGMIRAPPERKIMYGNQRGEPGKNHQMERPGHTSIRTENIYELQDGEDGGGHGIRSEDSKRKRSDRGGCYLSKEKAGICRYQQVHKCYGKTSCKHSTTKGLKSQGKRRFLPAA